MVSRRKIHWKFSSSASIPTTPTQVAEAKEAPRELLPGPKKTDLFIIDIANTLYVISNLMILCGPDLSRSSELALFYRIGYALLLIFGLCGWQQAKQQINHRSEVVALEHKKTTNLIAPFRLFSHVRSPYKDSYKATLDRMHVDPSDKWKVVLLPKTIKFQDQEVEIAWRIGEGTLLALAKDLQNIFYELQEMYVFHLLKTPRALSWIRQFAPHVTHCFDIPSKIRIMNYLTIPTLMASEMLMEYLPFSKDINKVVVAAWAVIMFLAAWTESYVLNQDKMKLNLEGFTHVYRKLWAWPPTCLSQQLTKKLVLYPSNKHFNEVVQFIISSKVALDELLRSRAGEIPDALRKQIEDFNARVVQEQVKKRKSNSLTRFSFYSNPVIPQINKTVPEPCRPALGVS